MSYIISSENDTLDWNSTGDDRIIQNVLNIVRTKKYEVPYMREMGIDPDFLDDAITKNYAEIVNDVTENINTYEPRVEVVDVSLSVNDANGDVVISVEVEVKT